jgi:preprotein translocase subunit Sec63
MNGAAKKREKGGVRPARAFLDVLPATRLSFPLQHASPSQDEDFEDSNSSSDFQSDSTDDDYAWIPWFCSLKGNEFFCEVATQPWRACV